MKPNDIILESISDGVFTVDEQWRITSFNRAAEEITGVGRDEALGRLCSEVFRSSLCGGACALRETMESGSPVVGRSAYIVDGEGERIPISLSTALLRDSEGRVVGGVETFRDLSEIDALRRELSGVGTVGDLVSHSPEMQRLFQILPAVATSPSSTLITGETGTGKEVLARAIHQMSSRSGGPFVAVNCGALPDTLLESELFGYKKGAFTGADRDKPGRFALAKGGTLFLDEIGEMSPALQVRLLRVLQERLYEPLGATQSEEADVRVIAATHRNLSDEIREGRFREDLYYRIVVMQLELPPLRRRKEDLPLLVNHFLERFNRLQQREVEGISPEALSLLGAYHWPGNIRELENVMERAFVLCGRGPIEIAHLPPEISARTGGGVEASGGTDLREQQRLSESEAIEAALRAHNFNRTAAARALGVHKTTLFRRIKALGIALPEQDGRSTRK